jgi:hypothetical protein
MSLTIFVHYLLLAFDAIDLTGDLFSFLVELLRPDSFKGLSEALS